MSNLHQIAVALRMYRQDYASFPPDLWERPIPPGQNWYGPDLTSGHHGPGYGLGALWPDYASNIKVFHCPANPIEELGRNGANPAYQSYDGEDPAACPEGNMGTTLAGKRVAYADTRFFSPRARLKYARFWRVARHGKTLTPDPKERRQILWSRCRPKGPYEPDGDDVPGNTVVTWCHSHRRHPDSPTLAETDCDLVVFLDGTTLLQKALSKSGHRSLGTWEP